MIASSRFIETGEVPFRVISMPHEIEGKVRRIVDTNGQVQFVVDEVDDGEYPAAGGGARQAPDDPHLGELAPGGTPYGQPGGEPPRWQSGQNLTAWSDQTDGAGRAGANPGGGGTLGVVDDGSDQTHASKPEGGQDDRFGYTGVPPHQDGTLEGPGDGKWPGGGQGDQQPGSSMPGGATGIPPSSSPVTRKSTSVQDKVYQQLLKNYPPEAIVWVRDAEWAGPLNVPFTSIDEDAVKSWAASHNPARVKHFKDKIEAGDPVHPAVSVREPGEDNVKIIDGHHRALAYQELGLPVRTYLGRVDSNGGAWDETHSSQFHQGSNPANKRFNPLESRGPHGEWTRDGSSLPESTDGPLTDDEKRIRAPGSVSGFIDLSQMDGVDYGFQREISQRVKIFVEKFPEAAKTMTSISSSSSMTDTTMASTHFNASVNLSSITLNLKYYGNRDSFKSKMASLHGSGFHPLGSTQSVIDHELGHVLDNARWDGTSASIPSRTAAFQQGSPALLKLGGYSEKNPAEAFAEAFSVWEAAHTGSLSQDTMGRKLSSQMIEILDKLANSEQSSISQKQQRITDDPPSATTCEGFVPDNVAVNKLAHLNKTDVNYRESGDPTRSCGTCVMFRRGGDHDWCTLVKGEIRASDTCDRWYGDQSDRMKSYPEQRGQHDEESSEG